MADKVINDTEFFAGLERWQQRFKVKADQGIRAVALRMFNNIIRRTPVDTGFARNNWYPSLNEKIVPPKGTKETADKTGSGALSKTASTVASGKMGDAFYLQNGVPYIGALENGHSGQAPEGMVALTLAETRAFFRQTFRRGASQ